MHYSWLTYPFIVCLCQTFIFRNEILEFHNLMKSCMCQVHMYTLRYGPKLSVIYHIHPIFQFIHMYELLIFYVTIPFQ